MGFLPDLVVATGLALLFLVLSWVYGRALSSGGALNNVKRRILAYGFVFVLGGVCMLMLLPDLKWPSELIFTTVGAWGALVGFIAWWRRRLR
jgi:hypothetical protein